MSQPGSEDIARHNDIAVALYSLAASVVRRMPRDISLTAAATLYALERHGPQRITRLAALEGVAQPSMTALVTKLEHDGLAERRSDPTDGRAVLVALTAAGERYVHERRQAGAAGLVRLIDDLPADHARSLRDALPALQAVAVLDHRDTGAASRLTPTPGGGPR
ncbi:MarR family transcriptional regulator [Acidiferrimicrobium sp. IK]|uniref:MarR family winged helix-turn-helix transcriptional regulator n=1 Tax=Acidiferrimicrobium sp. IK TaxID=2871700 RepID=UPI0021CB7712|nr:MarR family transcriptional regulator [Acidiferrimicrobium sp. IK]MCU4187484.1 MarR family transcriptional regulator [Acidiferrimicrobium sp. IK]